jgi:hypothetical protein
MEILYNMTEVLKIFRETSMLALDEQAHVKAAHGELEALLNLWIQDVEIELTLSRDNEFVLRPPKVTGVFPKRGKRNSTVRAQKRAAESLLEMLEIFHDEKKMRQEDYTDGQHGHILVAVQNILDALEQFEPKVKHKLGLLADRVTED